MNLSLKDGIQPSNLDMKIRNLKHEDLDEALKLSEREFGKKFHDLIHLTSFMRSIGTYALVGVVDQKIVGLLLVREMSNKDFRSKINNNIPSIELPQRFNYLDTIMVDSQYQKMRIGTGLLTTYFDQCKSDLKTAAIAWKNSDGLKVAPLFLSFEFKEYDEFSGIWDEDCNQNKYECAYKKEKCTCHGVLFVKD